MDKRKFAGAHRRAKNHLLKLDGACAEMAIMLQPYFDEEVHVLHQESDGFVVLHGENDWNTNVHDVIAAIEKDPDFFKPLNNPQLKNQ